MTNEEVEKAVTLIKELELKFELEKLHKQFQNHKIVQLLLDFLRFGITEKCKNQHRSDEFIKKSIQQCELALLRLVCPPK